MKLTKIFFMFMYLKMQELGAGVSGSKGRHFSLPVEWQKATIRVTGEK